jgi:(R,R)-butanediol dehydrogenase/meso-butanediol dehydrogenase/diacetyl reductase/L-iditol 2-dehydrogenase
MKSVVLSRTYDPVTKQKGDIACVDLPIPEISNDDDVLIKIAYAAICGTDPKLLEGFLSKKLGSPLGHEVSGTIAKLGPKANKKGFKAGDRVIGNFYKTCGTCHFCRNGQEQFCRFPEAHIGTMAEYIVWRESQVFKIPDSVDLMDAALTEPFTIAVHAIEKLDMSIGARLAISGGGGIGLMLVQLAKISGASTVTLIEPVASKRTLGLQLGADYVIDPINENVVEAAGKITDGFMYNAIIESSGNASSAEICLKITSPGATLLYMSTYKTEYFLPLNLFEYCYHKELRIQGMYLAQTSFPRAVAMLPRINFKPLISKVYALDDCRQAYDDAISGKYVKLLFDCQK